MSKVETLGMRRSEQMSWLKRTPDVVRSLGLTESQINTLNAQVIQKIIRAHLLGIDTETNILPEELVPSSDAQALIYIPTAEYFNLLQFGSRQLIKEFLKTLDAQINSPLMAIMGRLELYERKTPSPGEAKKVSDVAMPLLPPVLAIADLRNKAAKMPNVAAKTFKWRDFNKERKVTVDEVLTSQLHKLLTILKQVKALIELDANQELFRETEIYHHLQEAQVLVLLAEVSAPAN